MDLSTLLSLHIRISYINTSLYQLITKHYLFSEKNKKNTWTAIDRSGPFVEVEMQIFEILFRFREYIFTKTDIKFEIIYEWYIMR